MEGKKILINQPRSSYFVGGAEMISLEHAKNMEQQGHEVTFASIAPDTIGADYSQQYEALKCNTSIRFIELAQQSRALPWYDIDPGENRDRWNVEAMYYNASLFEYLQSHEENYDTMLSYYKFDALVIPHKKVARTALYLCGVPKTENEFMSSLLAMYDTSVAITDEVKEYWQRYSEKDISVVPTGVDTERFKPMQQPGDKITLTFIGRLIERKGGDLVLSALEKLDDEQLARLNVQIIGDGPQAEYLMNLASRLSERTSITFTGAVDRPEAFLGNSDICILPSRRGEGLQGVLLEAMSSGNKVIASSSKINDEILADGRGMLVNPEDVNSIVDAICRALSRSGNMQKDARAYVEARYQWDTVTRELLKRIV